jgi:hypothetical protein
MISAWELMPPSIHVMRLHHDHSTAWNACHVFGIYSKLTILDPVRHIGAILNAKELRTRGTPSA